MRGVGKAVAETRIGTRYDASANASTMQCLGTTFAISLFLLRTY